MPADPFDPSCDVHGAMAGAPGPYGDAGSAGGEGDVPIDAELAAMLEELTASPDMTAEPEGAASVTGISGGSAEESASAGDDAAVVPTTRFLVCTVAGTRCALPIANIVEVGRVPAAMPLPFVPAWLTGVINLRGQIVSLVDLAALLTGNAAPSPARMVVVQRQAGGIFGALLVDAVHGTRDVPHTDITTAGGDKGALFGGFVSAAFRTCDDHHPGGGDTGLAVPVLDLERLITSEHVQVSTSA